MKLRRNNINFGFNTWCTRIRVVTRVAPLVAGFAVAFVVVRTRTALSAFYGIPARNTAKQSNENEQF